MTRGVALTPASAGVAWISPRFWSRERFNAPESGAFNDAKDAKRSLSRCRKNAASLMSAAKSAWASATIRTLAQADRPNIQVRMSSQRSASQPVRLQRKTILVKLLNNSVSAAPKSKPRVPVDASVPEAWSRGCPEALLYNTVRPHSSLGCLTLSEFAARPTNAASRQQPTPPRSCITIGREYAAVKYYGLSSPGVWNARSQKGARNRLECAAHEKDNSSSCCHVGAQVFGVCFRPSENNLSGSTRSCLA